MKMTNKFKLFSLVLLAVVGLSSCDDDDDDSVVNYPDDWSLGWSTTGSRGQLFGFYDDDDNYYSFKDAYTDPYGRLEANTTYRLYVLYKNTSLPGTVEFYGGQTLDMQDPVTDGSVDEVKTDPIVSMDNVWVSNSGHFLNLEFTVFTNYDYDEETGEHAPIIKWLYLGQNEAGETEIRMYCNQNSEEVDYTPEDQASTFSCMPVAGNFHSNETVRIYYHTYDEGQGYESSWVITIPVLSPEIEDLYTDTHN